MFVQVVQGPLADREAMRRLGERWDVELRPGAIGFLGATIGVTDDGWLVNVARFESEDAARANSERPEQGEWWAEAAKCFAAEPTFVDSSDVELTAGGGSDAAGFVQVIAATVRDRAALTSIENEMMEALRDLRPELLGGIRVWDGARTIEVAYFTSEEEARKGEAMELPPDLQSAFERYLALLEGVEYRDLRDLTFL